MDGWTFAQICHCRKIYKNWVMKEVCLMHIILRSILFHGDNCICWGFMKPKKGEEPVKAQPWSQIPIIQLWSNARLTLRVVQTSVLRPIVTGSLVFFCQVIALILLYMGGRWHNQNVSVVWSDDSTHTHTHPCSAVTRCRAVCFSTEISCVSSLAYCSGCQNPHRYTSYTRWHIHTHSIAYPNQALGVLSLLLLLSLWSFTGVWFFIPFHSLTTLFLNPPPPFSNPLLSYTPVFILSLPFSTPWPSFYFLTFFLSITCRFFSHDILFYTHLLIMSISVIDTFTLYHLRMKHFRAHAEFEIEIADSNNF